ncbi:MAG: hypothetical protein K6E84_00855 [Lachnospiraceae bacterium]|nr:hypothetical protein [Lachnospiraceae bacterium]
MGWNMFSIFLEISFLASRSLTFAYLLGLKSLQAKYEDELPWLAGRPSLFPNPSMEEAINRIKAMRFEYDANLYRMMGIINTDIEEYIENHVDMVDQYYVRLDTRDMAVDPFIQKKPETLDEMNKLACSDMGFRLVQSAWREAYGSTWRNSYGFSRKKWRRDNGAYHSPRLNHLFKKKDKILNLHADTDIIWL